MRRKDRGRSFVCIGLRFTSMKIFQRTPNSVLAMMHRVFATVAQRRTPAAVASQRWMATKRQKRLAEQQAAASLANASEASASQPNTIETPVLQTPSSSSPLIIKTDLRDHKELLINQRPIFDANNPPPYAPDESGVVQRDLTETVIDLEDLYDPRLHFDTKKEFTEEYEERTPLSDEIIRRIAVSNRPITSAEYMHHALTHPQYGYYTNPTKNENDDDWDDVDDDWDNDEEEKGTADLVIGPKGDFVTAPEVSQVFGECLTVWFITQWKETLQKPKEVQLVEVGPGKGTLMADIVRSALDSFEDFGSTICRIHLVEKSSAMRSEQQERLSKIDKANWIFGTKVEEKAEIGDDDAAADASTSEGDSKPTIQVTWHDSFTSVLADAAKQEKKIPSLVVCQEFIDALPVNVFEKTTDGWRERLVDINKDPEKGDNDDSNSSAPKSPVFKAAKENLKFKPERKTRLRFAIAPDTTPALRTLLNVDKSGCRENDTSEVGQVIEVCPEGIIFVQDVQRLLSLHGGGAALVVDYGQEGSGDTLRGFSNHKQVHPLTLPGQVDVTADVDFEALRYAVNAKKALAETEGEEDPNPPQAFGPVPQGKFLASMGVVERVTNLIENEDTTDQQAEDLCNALERLVTPEHMGERYKVMAIARKKEGLFPPAGF